MQSELSNYLPIFRYKLFQKYFIEKGIVYYMDYLCKLIPLLLCIINAFHGHRQPNRGKGEIICLYPLPDEGVLPSVFKSSKRLELI